MLKRRYSQNGFSLIEVVIALIILSVVIVGLSRSFRDLSVASNATRAHTVALNLARQRIEFLKQFETSPSNSTSTILANINTYSTSAPSSKTINGIVYTISTTAFSGAEKNTSDLNAYSNITPLHIQVSWSENGINKGRITLDSYYQ